MRTSKSVVEPEMTNDVTVWHMLDQPGCTHALTRMLPGTHPHALTRTRAHTDKYVIRIVFPLQQCFRERASLLRYTSCCVLGNDTYQTFSLLWNSYGEEHNVAAVNGVGHLYIFDGDILKPKSRSEAHQQLQLQIPWPLHRTYWATSFARCSRFFIGQKT